MDRTGVEVDGAEEAVLVEYRYRTGVVRRDVGPSVVVRSRGERCYDAPSGDDVQARRRP